MEADSYKQKEEIKQSYMHVHILGLLGIEPSPFIKLKQFPNKSVVNKLQILHLLDIN